MRYIFLVVLCTMVYSIGVFAQEYKLVGTALLEYSIFKFDIYQASYYKGEVSKKIVLEYKRDIERKYSIEGWKVGLSSKIKDPKYKEKVQWLMDHTTDVVKGDVLSLIKNGENVKIIKNANLIAEVSDPL